MFRTPRLASSLALVASAPVVSVFAASEHSSNLDATLRAALDQAGFTGTVGSSIEQRLGRPIDSRLANLGGRLLWFDPGGGFDGDNTCGGCHSPANGFGDTQSIAIGLQNNHRVGPNRSGPRN